MNIIQRMIANSLKVNRIFNVHKTLSMKCHLFPGMLTRAYTLANSEEIE